jgi:hypothetical protein
LTLANKELEMSKKDAEVWINVFDNDNDALTPEIWAQESLLYLENNMVAGMLVYRDFENEVAKFGDVVNTRRPNGFVGHRKVDGDSVEVQDASSTNVAVRLDQHWHVSFIIYDGEESKSMADLIEFHAGPALSAIAQSIDQVVLGETYNFMGTPTNGKYAGKLGSYASITDGTPIIDLRTALTNNKCPMAGRRLLLSPNVEGAFLGVTDFVNANTVGDEGTALREGHLGRKYGFNTFVSQNVPSIDTGNTVVVGAINNGNVAKGSTTLTVDGFDGEPARLDGSWCTIAGDATPQRIVSGTKDTDDDLVQIVVSPGLRHAVEDGAAVTVYTPGSINDASNYAQYWTKAMTVNNFSVAPKSGQLVAFGSATDLYGTVGTPTTTSMLMSRSLDAGVNNAANVNIGPAGDYCLGFHPAAIALVTRPLVQVRAGTGARSFVASYNGLSIRATIGYNMDKQGHQVTLDMLAGVKTLDENLGAVMFA